ncbi:NTP transferase domain-containing protein [Alicyclobacillus tolerans]|uniref:sugar phosphate nucleotidyltransferase n=1 Tax=Alicyclobacillus tolerans TaxID=90970 RepID=UPI001F1C6E4C|nr:sugar phosphate nucleotidyltransferase [Alicyclobacillus tolerans]MCF8563933.1 NTP transferase domain-containing protein [Alicyclobacillus tolerans]
MKAVIMAGGKGTRLRPLTCHLPKPMVPLLDRPCMEYIIDLLKRYGITEIAVTVQYLPQVIKTYFGDGRDFGVHLRYFDETTPLGTAGSVKNAEEFLDDTFIVISGDALTDFNLMQAVDYHRNKEAIGTLVLTTVDVPLEYGVVMTDPNGRVVRFVEKPSWSEVFSDTVNTGIYILEPQIFNFMAKNQEFDFSKDLFPLLMNQGLPLYGFKAQGYWSDIGCLTQYRKTQFDMLDGRVQVQIGGVETLPKVWIGEDAVLDPTVNIEGPAFIGKGATIHRRTHIGPYAVVGRNSRLQERTSVERTVLWNHASVGKSATLCGATVCSRVRVLDAATVHEDAVIGNESVVGDSAVIMPKVKIWPQKDIEPSTVQQYSVIWESSPSRTLFGAQGISGTANCDFTPERVSRIAAAYGSCLRRGSKVTVTCDEHPYSNILKYAVISSLLAIGAQVRDAGITLVPVARYECRRSASQGAIHIRMLSEDEDRMAVLFFDSDGLPISRGMERKVENAFYQEDFVRPDPKQPVFVEQVLYSAEAYSQSLLKDIDVHEIRDRKLRIVFQSDNRQVRLLMHSIFERLGCSVITVMNPTVPLEKVVAGNLADLGVSLDAGAETLGLVTEQGKLLSSEQVMMLQALMTARKHGTVAIPVTAPDALEGMIRTEGVVFARTPTTARPILEVGKGSAFQLPFDGVYSIVCIFEYLSQQGLSLGAAVDGLPEFHMRQTDVSCPANTKGQVMRQLMQETAGHLTELIDGIKIRTDDGWALVLPELDRAVIRVIAEAATDNRAGDLAAYYTERISAYKKG